MATGETMTFFAQELWEGRGYIGGWVRLDGTATVTSPQTGSAVAEIGVGSAADMAEAIERADAAQREWARRPAQERADVMHRVAGLLEEHADVLSRWLIDEAGSAQGKAAFEVGLVVSEARQAAATAVMPYGQLLTSIHPRLSLARHRPVGVVGVISPFNFPAILATRSVFPALALGNAVVLKPDPRTSIAGGLFLAAILEEAGLPAGLFAVVPGGVDTATVMIDHPGVPVISFTGSTAAGRAIGERAGKNLKRAHLELGGNNAMIVMPDVDVAAAASAGAWGSFLHQGQICMTTGRHIVHADVYDEYLSLLSEKARALKAADPSTGAPLGPIIDVRQRDRVHDLVTATVGAGASLSAGGTYTDLFYQPTVLGDVRPEHVAFTDEIFGPVAPVLRFDDIDEAIDMVNATEYGLSVAILAGDAFRAFELADQIDSGIVHINDQTVDDEAQAPFGGTGHSGTGARFGGHEANIEAFTDTQWVTVQSSIQQYPF
ncbi:aldehyde dehydrogenase family protein [Microbacterium thalassium]|uniref:Benzaldehyde dehydrogenase (NAD) n=1 Tax=Microbacterium thalassium TaxID=362649 RepID=A0A7X0FPA4_9MICO|nr:aldehyde dehydrogenase family protein [Microbacterium thalassium]MBB6391209.1 benzaldehyde dehydrogenase (NAD) [Microbacterium thalassium]GLK23681.1 aldehyde dehydrogenase [Microbacterium thalassium]